MDKLFLLIQHPHVLKLAFLSISGLLIRQSLVISGQRWANTYHHLGSYMLLPCISLIITSIIKDDIALSLGMIGALSIVRFRNPVKSPFELVIFFGLITLGIVNSVSFTLSILLFLFIIIIIFGIKIGEKIFSKIGVNIFQYSFGDGNLNYVLEVISKNELETLSNSVELLHYNFDKIDNNYSYRLAFQNRKKLIEFQNLIKNNKDILSIRVDMQS